MSRALSPLSIPYRILERGTGLVFGTLAIVTSGGSQFVGLEGRVLAGAAALGVIALVAGYEVARHRRYGYEVVDDTLAVRSGVLARRSREVPLSRVQNVDVTQNAIQRVLGIAGVDFETAGGGGAEARFRYVAREEADRLQEVVRRFEEGEPGDDSAATVEEEELFALSTRELLLVGALSFDRRVPGLVAFAVTGSVPVAVGLGVLPAGALGIALLAAGVAFVGWAVGAAATIANYYGFRLTRTETELRYERGLVRRYSGSIPFEKVQTLTVGDDPLKRLAGYATLAVETAGGVGGDDQGSTVAVPLARRGRVVDLAGRLEGFGDPAFDRPPRRTRRRYAMRYLIGIAAVGAILFGVERFFADLPVPWYAVGGLALLVPPAAHLKWRHRGYWLGPDHVVTRNGFWRRRTKVVPYYRVQTVIDRRNPFQRRWRIATVVVDTAGALSLLNEDAMAVDVDDQVAADLRERINDRLQAALRERRRRRESPGDAAAPGDDPAGVPASRGPDSDSGSPSL